MKASDASLVLYRCDTINNMFPLIEESKIWLEKYVYRWVKVVIFEQRDVRLFMAKQREDYVWRLLTFVV